jgi:hypothetical protein
MLSFLYTEVPSPGVYVQVRMPAAKEEATTSGVPLQALQSVGRACVRACVHMLFSYICGARRNKQELLKNSASSEVKSISEDMCHIITV